MSIWFEGENEVNCSLDQVCHALDDLGGHYLALLEFLPSVTSVELVDQSGDSVTIRTNEGLIRRTNITRELTEDRATVEFDEVFEGPRVTINARYVDEFTRHSSGVRHHLTISDMKTRGFLGSLYRMFGARSNGKAFLGAYKACLEGTPGHA